MCIVIPILSCFEKIIFVPLLCAISLLWNTACFAATTSPTVLWIEPVKTGYLTDGSAFCDLQIRSSEPDFSVGSLRIRDSFCQHLLQKNRVLQTPLQRQEEDKPVFRVITPVYSTVTVFVNATYQNTDYMLQTQVRLLGKGYNAKTWLDAYQKYPVTTPAALSFTSRFYAIKGTPIRFQYQKTEKQISKNIGIYSPADKKTESVVLSPDQTFTYQLPAAQAMKADYAKYDPRVFINTIEENNKYVTLTSYVRFYDNRYNFRNLKHGLSAFLAGCLLTAAAFLWYLRRSSYHAH